MNRIFKGFLAGFLLIQLGISQIGVQAQAASVAAFTLCDLSDETFEGYCLNEGTCYNIVNQTNYDRKIFCACPPEYTGKRCEEILMRPEFIPFTSTREAREKKDVSSILVAQRSIKKTEFCSSIDCKNGEICKYFDSNMYRCPDEIMDCVPYKKASRIPICVATNFNDQCMESLKMGNCDTYKERYYFDLVDKKCKKFYFTGCNGNRNNFESLTECSNTCAEIPTVKVSKPKVLLPITARKTLKTKMEGSMLPRLRADNKCEFVCSLNCPFGFRLNYRTNCPICECSPLAATECGVPCFTPGSKSCEFSMRANSRPTCVCEPSYDGVYCHIYTKSANLTLEFNQPIQTSDSFTNELRTNLREALCELLVVGRKSVQINEIYSNADQKTLVNINVRATDFSTPHEFENMVEFLKFKIEEGITVNIGNQNVAFVQSNELPIKF